MALNERTATNVGPAGIEIAYERRGNLTDPVVLLIMGGAAQLVHWPEGFLAALLCRGLQVIRFDNRDAGCSTHFHDAPKPDVRAALAGDLSSAAYTLSDMAADTVGLLDAFEINAAHVVGLSLGGAIAQTIAIEHPARILSLTSMMSTTGNMTVGQPHPETLKAVFGGPPATTRQAVIDRAVRAFSIIGSPAYPTDATAIAERAGLAWDRGHDEIGIARQALAFVASGDRTARLQKLDVPALVIHGLSDTLVDASGGRATAAAIPGAELVLIEGLGHNLPLGLWDRIADHIAELVRRGEALQEHPVNTVRRRKGRRSAPLKHAPSRAPIPGACRDGSPVGVPGGQRGRHQTAESRTRGELVFKHERARAAHVLGLLHRLGAGRDGRPALCGHHADADRRVGHVAGAGRHAGHGRIAVLLPRRLAGRHSCRSVRPRRRPAVRPSSGSRSSRFCQGSRSRSSSFCSPAACRGLASAVNGPPAPRS